MKLDSNFLKEKNQIKLNKIIGRFFKEPFDFSKTTIIKEKAASPHLLTNFASFNESAFKMLEDIKKA